MTSPGPPPPGGGGPYSGPSSPGPWTASLSGLDMLVTAALGTPEPGHQMNMPHPVSEDQFLAAQPAQPVQPTPLPQELSQPANAEMAPQADFQPPSELPFEYIQQAIDAAVERHRARTVSQQQNHQQTQAPQSAPNQHLGHPAHYHAGSQMPCFSPACIGNPNVGWIFSNPAPAQQGQQAAAVPAPPQSAHQGQNFSNEQTQMSAYEPMFMQPPGNFTYPANLHPGAFGGQPPPTPMGYPIGSPFNPTVPMATGPHTLSAAASSTSPVAANHASASTATASQGPMPPPAASTRRKPSASRPPRSRKRSQKENAPKYSERLKGVGVPTSALSADAIAAGLAWRQGHDVQTAASSDATVRQRPTQDPLMVNAQLPTTATSQAPSPAPTEVNGVRMTVNANPAQYRVTSRVADHISSSGFIHDARRLPLSGTAAPTAPMARPLLPTHFFGPGAHMAAVSAPTHVNYGNPFAPAAGGSQLSAEPQLPAYMNGPRQAPVAPAAPFTSPAGIQSGHETPGRRQSRRASQGTASAEKSKRTASDMEDDGSDDSQQSPSARAAKRRKSGSANGSAGRRT